MQIPFNTNDDIFEFFDEADEDWALSKQALRNHLQAVTACVSCMKDFVAILVRELFTERYQIKHTVGVRA